MIAKLSSPLLLIFTLVLSPIFAQAAAVEESVATVKKKKLSPMAKAQARVVYALLTGDDQDFINFMTQEDDKYQLGIRPINLQSEGILAAVTKHLREKKSKCTIQDLPEDVREKEIYPLALAARLWQMKALDYLCRKYPKHIDIRSGVDQLTALMRATLHNHTDAIRVLLLNNANPCLKYSRGNLSQDVLDIVFAKYPDNWNLAQLFYQRLENPSIARIIMFDDGEEMEKLLKRDPSAIHKKLNEDGMTPFMMAIWRRSRQVANVLFEHGADVWAATESGKTAEDYAGEDKIMQGFVENCMAQADMQALREAAAAAQKKEARALRKAQAKSQIPADMKPETPQPPVKSLEDKNKEKADKKHLKNEARKEKKAKELQDPEHAAKREKEQKELEEREQSAKREQEQKELQRERKRAARQAKKRAVADEKKENEVEPDHKGLLRSIFDRTIFRLEEPTEMTPQDFHDWITNHASQRLAGAVKNSLMLVLPLEVLPPEFALDKGSYTIDSLLAMHPDQETNPGTYHVSTQLDRRNDL